jgi:hypothetical protein
MGFMRTVRSQVSGLPQRCAKRPGRRSRRTSRSEGPIKASSQVSTLVATSLPAPRSLTAETAAQATASASRLGHASLLSVERDPHGKRVPRSVAPYDADRLLYVTRVPIRAVGGAVTQLNSRLVRQLCTMSSGRTATWRQPVHSTFTRPGGPFDVEPRQFNAHSHRRTGYNSLTFGKAPFCSVRD